MRQLRAPPRTVLPPPLTPPDEQRLPPDRPAFAGPRNALAAHGHELFARRAVAQEGLHGLAAAAELGPWGDLSGGNRGVDRGQEGGGRTSAVTGLRSRPGHGCGGPARCCRRVSETDVRGRSYVLNGPLVFADARPVRGRSVPAMAATLNLPPDRPGRSLTKTQQCFAERSGGGEKGGGHSRHVSPRPLV
jgi:hypothetical protein